MLQWISGLVGELFKQLAAFSFMSVTFISPTVLPTPLPLSLNTPPVATSSTTITNNGSSVAVTVQTGGQTQERTITTSQGTTVSQSITTSDAKAEAHQIISGNTNGNSITVETNSGGNIQKVDFIR